MRVFVTGATGFIGVHVVKELISAGHKVIGLARSEAAARSLVAAGADVHRGSLEDTGSLRRGAALSEGIIHLGFIHDFSSFEENCDIDRRAIEAMGSALAVTGSARPFLITSGTGMGNVAPDRPATEDSYNPGHPNPRTASEIAAHSALARGVNVSVVRLPQVHDTRRQGLVTYAIDLARRQGMAAYIGEGRNRWPAAHVRDVARLYRLALERHEMGACYHAVAEEGVPMRTIAETIGRGLGVPAKSIPMEEAPAHFGWLSLFAGSDMPASSLRTRQVLGWHPAGPGLLADLENADYATAPEALGRLA